MSVSTYVTNPQHFQEDNNNKVIMSYQNSNIFLRADGCAGGLTPLISPVAKFTFDAWTDSRPASARKGTKISLKRDSSGKKKNVTFSKILRREFVSTSLSLTI